MKKVILEKLTLTNFKGEKERTTLFSPSETTIAGANGLGKSRHFEAFVWLLFGKDMQDRSNYEVKTRLANSEELHKVECSVEGVLRIDGEGVTLKRAIIENWVKPRGQKEQIYKGDQTLCWWNNAPISVTEYNKRVAEIIDTNVFKMITNPAFFANMKWQLQREQLFQLAGTITNEEIAQGNDSYKALLDKIGGKPLSDFKAEHNAKKKRLKAELDEIQPRIDQTYKMKPEGGEDYDLLEQQKATIEKEIEELDKQMASIAEADKAQDEERQAIIKQINALQTESSNLIFASMEKAQREGREANAKHRELEQRIADKRADEEQQRKKINAAQLEITRLHDEVHKLRTKQEELRQVWREENAKVFEGGGVCEYCGQPLPETMIAKAREKFNEAKAKRCEENVTEGKRLGALITQNEQAVLAQQEIIDDAKAIISNISPDVIILSDELSSIPEVKAIEVKGEDIPEWVQKQEEVKRLKDKISSVKDDKERTAELSERKKELNVQRDEVNHRLLNAKIIARCEREIVDLEAQGRELAQQIADLEGEEFILQEFTRAKIDECEKRINGLFKIVKFRLFNYTLESNALETCIPLIDGVPYGSANTASQINAGIDIINTLCRFYGVSAPIFIDRRESVQQLLPTESQVINLVVSNDKELKIINQ